MHTQTSSHTLSSSEGRTLRCDVAGAKCASLIHFDTWMMMTVLLRGDRSCSHQQGAQAGRGEGTGSACTCAWGVFSKLQVLSFLQRQSQKQSTHQWHGQSCMRFRILLENRTKCAICWHMPCGALTSTQPALRDGIHPRGEWFPGSSALKSHCSRQQGLGVLRGWGGSQAPQRLSGICFRFYVGTGLGHVRM